jgi:hypothetical protein
VKRLQPVLLALLAAVYVATVLPAWRAVTGVTHGRDYATYHYAAQEARAGGDPYDAAALSRRARAEGTRAAVHPWFYPPPALLPFEPLSSLPLSTAYRAWFFVQQACLLGALWGMWRWFGARPLLLGLLAVVFTPIPDNLKMGQANLPVLLLTVLGLWRGSGLLVGAAAMAKMSPALYLASFAAQRRWRPILVAVATAVGLSVLALPLVPLSTQVRFYIEILPGFASGHYNGLGVPISLPANHSIPDLLHQLWPGPDAHSLDTRARIVGQALSLSLLALLSWLGRAPRDPLSQANHMGAMTVLLLITPVYAYEHHLVLALLPAAAALQALWEGRLPRRWLWLVLPALFFVAWPLYWLRDAQKALPALSWWLQESKFLGLVGLGLANVVAGRR